MEADDQQTRLPQWVIWRQDDNGHKFIVKVTDSRSEAEDLLKTFEGKGHKQLYWIEPFKQ